MHIWNLETRRPLAALDGHGGQCVTWLHTLPRGPQLLRWAVVVLTWGGEAAVGLACVSQEGLGAGGRAGACGGDGTSPS